MTKKTRIIRVDGSLVEALEKMRLKESKNHGIIVSRLNISRKAAKILTVCNLNEEKKKIRKLDFGL